MWREWKTRAEVKGWPVYRDLYVREREACVWFSHFSWASGEILDRFMMRLFIISNLVYFSFLASSVNKISRFRL